MNHNYENVIKYFSIGQMAFGSWFKNIVKGASNLIGKIAPKIKSAVESVGKFAPLISQAGDLIGGNVGGVISNIGNFVGSNDVRGNSVNKLSNNISPKIVGANGSGIRRFDVPLLK